MPVHRLTLFISVAVITFGVGFLALPRELFLSRLTLLIGKLGGGRINGIAGIDGVDDELDLDRVFWPLSGQATGMTRRLLIDLPRLLLVMQCAAILDPKLFKREGEMLRLATAQVIFSLLAYPEAVACSIWPDTPHSLARLAAIRHVRLTFGLQNVFLSGDALGSVGKLF